MTGTPDPDAGRAIPEPLRSAPLIRLRPGSKAPVKDARAVEPVEKVGQWLANGGNAGVACLGPWIVVDVDHDRLADLADDLLPATFTVETGSGGEHRYFKCDGPVENRQLSAGGDDLGSIRSDGWQVVAPPSIHPSGRRYRVADGRDLADVERATLQTFADRAAGGEGRSRGGTAGPRPPGRVGQTGVGAPIPSIPEGYPDVDIGPGACRRRLAEEGLFDRLHRRSDDESGDEFVVAKCLAEVGYAESVIRAVLDDGRPPGSKWHRRGATYRQRTVRRAIQAAADDPFVDWGSE